MGRPAHYHLQISHRHDCDEPLCHHTLAGKQKTELEQFSQNLLIIAYMLR